MNESKLSEELIEKYNVASPRYTSYPTILDWNQPDLDELRFKTAFSHSFQTQPTQPASIYIHLPFCESLCTFCGCHKHITKNHEVEEPYINALIKEWNLYEQLAGREILVEELHLGGGTPTFFSTLELGRLIRHITKNRTREVNFSIEGHPNHTSSEQLTMLFDLGFRRVSFGVQDYDQEVQKAINRIQSFEQVKKVTDEARSIGFKSISHDLVFGLPKQTMAALQNSIEKTISLLPDNISLYSYAHVPWVKGTGQRGFSEEDLPSGAEKRALYEYAKEALLQAGYLEIGMDHFGLPTEPMTVAMQNKQLNRNFMGYTTAKTERLIALGVSAISEFPFGYAQNVKSVKEYHEKINAGKLPVFKGHFHSEVDQELKHHIKELMCNFQTHFSENSWIANNMSEFKEQLNDFQRDGIIEWEKESLRITEQGKPFVRNVCMLFDPYSKKDKAVDRFSKSV
jgi:oxygen-independent coproporphyrinogen-3 oxidase